MMFEDCTTFFLCDSLSKGVDISTSFSSAGGISSISDSLGSPGLAFYTSAYIIRAINLAWSSLCLWFYYSAYKVNRQTSSFLNYSLSPSVILE